MVVTGFFAQWMLTHEPLQYINITHRIRSTKTVFTTCLSSMTDILHRYICSKLTYATSYMLSLCGLCIKWLGRKQGTSQQTMQPVDLSTYRYVMFGARNICSIFFAHAPINYAWILLMEKLYHKKIHETVDEAKTIYCGILQKMQAH